MIASIESGLSKKGWRKLADGTMEKVVDEYHGEDIYGRGWVEPTTANVELYPHEGKIFGAVYMDKFDPDTFERHEKFNEEEVDSAEAVEDIVAGL